MKYDKCLREELFHQVNQYKFHHRYLNFLGVKSLTLRTTFVILRGLLEENNNSSTRFKTEIRILSNKFCEIEITSVHFLQEL
jgi:hypothetical protein